MSPAPVVALRNVCKSFGAFKALKGVSLEVFLGEVVCVIGASGSGKTTLLRCINQLVAIDGGTIRIEGELLGFARRRYPLAEREIARQRTATAMVFQRFNLFPHMTALEDVMEGLIQVLRRDRGEALALLERFGLANKAGAYPANLSGGQQQQRVAIARCLCLRPNVMLFDEPTSALDPELVGDVLAVMRELARGGMTMLLVAHELSFACDVTDRVVFIDHGLVVESGPARAVLPELKEARTRAFLFAALA